MEDTVTCPNCTNENAFFNGLCFECPECDYEWSSDVDFEDEEDNPEIETKN